MSSSAPAPASLVAERVRERLRAERADPSRDLELADESRAPRRAATTTSCWPAAPRVADDEPACVREVLAAVAGSDRSSPSSMIRRSGGVAERSRSRVHRRGGVAKRGPSPSPMRRCAIWWSDAAFH